MIDFDHLTTEAVDSLTAYDFASMDAYQWCKLNHFLDRQALGLTS